MLASKKDDVNQLIFENPANVKINDEKECLLCR
jgi:hypothetical protein